MKKWTRNEIILALALYYTIPHSEHTIKNPEIVALSETIRHSVNSVKMILQNFKSVDPEYIQDGKRGLENISKLSREIVVEYTNRIDVLFEEANRIRNENY